MKYLTICLFALLFANTSEAQLTPTQAHKETLKAMQQTRGPQVSKGYYSIGSNAQKLYANRTKACCANANDQQLTTRENRKVAKGFFALGNNSRKLNAATQPVVGSNETPNVTKGYYSIGGNAAKLETTND